MELNTIQNKSNWGKATESINTNFAHVGSEIDKLKYAAYNSKLYPSLEVLQQEKPNPSVGDWAIVGDTIPGAIYRCSTEGVWSATGETGGGYGMNVTETNVTENNHYGDIINNPDDEDLTEETNENEEKVMKLADKEYNAAGFSGLGRVYLRKNVTSSKNVLTKDMINKPNTRYIIQYDYDLNGATINIPEGVSLEFQGGSFKNGTITGNNTIINSNVENVFNTNVTVSGTWKVKEWYAEWFGAKGDGVTDDTSAIQKAINSINNKGTLRLLNKTYAVSQIDMTRCRNVEIAGTNDAVEPWTSQTTLKCNSEVDFVIKVVADYDDTGVPSVRGYALSFKNLYIDGNQKANNGINMNYNIVLTDIFVRNCKIDGIVFEAMTYPVYLTRVVSQYNGRHGIYIKPRYTTCYYLNQVECRNNGAYGMWIEGGNTCTFINVLAQSNKAGGVKIKQVDAKAPYQEFLGNLSFIGLYTEANGTLEEDDENYDGNYSLSIQGRSEDASVFSDKIYNLSFINCKVDNHDVRGVYRLNIFGTEALTSGIDYTKNIPPVFTRLQVGALVLGSYGNQPLTYFDNKINKANLFFLCQGTGTESVITPDGPKSFTYYTLLNNRFLVDFSITYTAKSVSTLHATLYFLEHTFVNSNPQRLLIGTIKVYDPNSFKCNEYYIGIEPYESRRCYLYKKETLQFVSWDVFPENGILYGSIQTMAKKI